jgi:hypothetical protein
MDRPRTLAAATAVVLASCAPPAPRLAPIPTLPFAADSTRAEFVSRGVTHWYLYAATGPWAIHALVVDRDACYSAVALKPGGQAAGREKTSSILARFDDPTLVVAGVNADFFAPSGAPTGTMLRRGRLITGPSQQPVLAFDSLGNPSIVTLRATGSFTVRGTRVPIAGWNRRVADGVAYFDTNWGRVTDTASATIEVALGGEPRLVSFVDTSTNGIVLADFTGALVGRGAGATPLRTLRPGDTVSVEVTLAPMFPREAVGGRPALVRDSAILARVDTEGGPGFATGRHPRTAVGIARQGQRLILAVVDGRQKPYSDGMTLRELATLMLALGARDAINLDGGGSTTMVIADPSGGGLRVVNRPSDPTGERAVGNALAIVRECVRR